MTAIPFSLTLLTLLGVGASNDVSIGDAEKDPHGFLVHRVKSPFQAGITQIRVLLPDKFEKNKRYPVIFVLPVEAGTEDRYGDGLVEIKRRDLHNKSQAIFVAPTFSQLPWYADHPTKPEIRQETYFLTVVVPFIEKHYPALRTPAGRLLLGFSKSGWGAFSLLLRHRDVFGKAAAWDAPFMMQEPNKFGMAEIFGTQANFNRYQLTRLLQDNAGRLGQGKRLLVLGTGNFHDHHTRVYQLMKTLKIEHDFREGQSRKHDWHSGWAREAVQCRLPEPVDGGRRVRASGNRTASTECGLSQPDRPESSRGVPMHAQSWHCGRCFCNERS